MKLEELGWSEWFQAQLDELEDETLVPARVSVEHRRGYTVLTPTDELEADVPGRLRKEAEFSSDLPGVGDWVALRLLPGENKAVIEAILPRRSQFSRKVAGEQVDEQVVAANVDHVFLVSAMNEDLNLRRIERYLTLAWESGAQPVVVLTKSDLCDEVDAAMASVVAVSPGAPVHATSTINDLGFDELEPYLTTGTVAVMGSSGVGKSTLINRLMGREHMKVAEIRWDGKGRHTTTHRELVRLPQGGWIIDTPGMREIQLWDAGEGLEAAFSDIAELAAECKFNDCRHETEPDCAVKLAVEEKVLDPQRLESYRKQLREMAALARKIDKRLASAESKKWSKVYKEASKRARQR